TAPSPGRPSGPRCTSTTRTSTAPKRRRTTKRSPTGNAGDTSKEYETPGQGCTDHGRRQRHRPAIIVALRQGRRQGRGGRPRREVRARDRVDDQGRDLRARRRLHRARLPADGRGGGEGVR